LKIRHFSKNSILAKESQNFENLDFFSKTQKIFFDQNDGFSIENLVISF